MAASVSVIALDREDDVEEVTEAVRQVAVRDLVSGLTTFGGGNDQSTSAQARQVVAGVRSGHPGPISEFARVRRTVQQGHEQVASVRVGQGATDSMERLMASRKLQHRLNITAKAE
jgi:hypothetical protein